MNIENFKVSNEWKQAYPNALVGVMIITNTINRSSHPELDMKMEEIESEIRINHSQSGRDGIRELSTIQAYTTYYKKFKKTYHVQLQLESIALKNRHLPRISTLVSSMFAAELKNQLLTAGHDLLKLKFPLVLDVSKGEESYVGMGGKVNNLSINDMFISDNERIISSIIYGPDNRTSITKDTTDVIFTVYGPEGISSEQISDHLKDICSLVKISSPNEINSSIKVFGA
jgi:DNA/RNA-binding domain of Phe-tRNA-synthetase-like protein